VRAEELVALAADTPEIVVDLDPTINLATFVTVVEGGDMIDRWPVAARGIVQ
jgi:hypothetical protein